MYLEKIIKRFKDENLYKKYAPIGWSEEQIKSFETKLGLKIPIAFKEYLLWGGMVAGILDQKFDMPFERTLNLTENQIATMYLQENKDSQIQFKDTLPENAIVLTTDQVCQFWFIKINENNDNPPVYQWTESENLTSFTIIFHSFSDYFTKIFEGHFKTIQELENSLVDNPNDSFLLNTEKSRRNLYKMRCENVNHNKKT